MATPTLSQQINIGNAPQIQTEDLKHVGDPNSAKMVEVSAEAAVMHAKANVSMKKVGIGNSEILQSVPRLNKGTGERYVEYRNINAHIRFGADRPSDRLSGYGGVGIKDSNTIDLVVGKMGPVPRVTTKDNKELFTENNFSMDAARIYISQRTDIDHNFNIKSQFPTTPAINCSAIALKADSIRVVARDDVRIVTGVDLYSSKGDRPGVDYAVPHKICLIGDNKEEFLQPMVKGDNLKNCLNDMIDLIKEILNVVRAFMEAQNKFNGILSDHTHIVTVPGKEGIPSFSNITEGKNKIWDIMNGPYVSIFSSVNNTERTIAKFFDSPPPVAVADDNFKDTILQNILSNYNYCN